MKTIAAKTADLNTIIRSIYENVYTEEGAKEAARIRRLAKKQNTDFESVVRAETLKKIKFGAIRLGSNFWYPVVDGEIQPHGHTFSTGAMSDTVHIAGQQGIKVRV